MKKLFTLLIVLLLMAGSSWAQSISVSLSNIPEKKVANINAKHDPIPPAPLGILQGGETIATATVISSLPYTDIGTTAGYADNYNEVCPYGTTGGKDVVYSYTPAADGAIDISLCNDATAYDTKLYVYDTPTPVTGDAIVCNDDLCSTLSYPSPYVSELSSVPVTGGTTYYIVVDGYGSGDYGAYEITVTGSVIYPVPPNDDCTGATVVSGPFPQTVTGTTLGATVDCPGLLDWNAVWYAVTLPYATNNLTVDWCGTANMSSVGVVYYTTCPVVCANYLFYTSNTWQVCGTPAGATTALTSFLNIPGPATIYYPAYSVPQMDHVLTFNVTGVAGPGCGNTDLGLITPTNTSQSAPYVAGDSYYWSFNATATNLYTFSSCGAGEDTYLRIYNSSGTLVAENDDYGPHCSTTEASIDWLATESGLYYVSLAAWSCIPLVNGGNLVYYYTPTVPGCGATNLGLITPTTSPQTAAYTAGSTYYWSFNANAGDIYTFSDCGGLSEDSYIRIYNSSFSQIASADDYGPHCTTAEASVDWTATASGLYYVSLAHFSCNNLVNSDNFTYYYTQVLCPPPNSTLSSNYTTVGADLSWNYGISSFFDIYICLPLDPPPTEVSIPTVNDWSLLYYTWTGGDEATSYDWYVRTDCEQNDIDVSSWTPGPGFTTLASCPAPSNGTATNLTLTSADLGWTSNATGTTWDVELGLTGFTVDNGEEVMNWLETEYNPLTVNGLDVGTTYDFYVREICGFDANAQVEHFYMAQNSDYMLEETLSGAYTQVIDPGEDLIWRRYDQTEFWYNIWFYNGPLDLTRMKKIRMGFWIQKLDPDLPAYFDYVVNWSTPEWVTPDPPVPYGYPTPLDEIYIERSEAHGQTEIFGVPQWVEIYYTIPDYNPEWVSVDIWGANIIILNELQSPPVNSPLYYWWQLEPEKGGILVHECLPKPSGDMSNWAGPYTFSTSCNPLSLPICESFPDANWPICWTEQFTGLITYSHWSMVNSNVAGGTAYEAMASYSPAQGATQADNDRMVSPPINTTSITSLNVSFRQMLNDYDAGINDVWIKVQSSSDGTNWTDEWVYAGGLGVSIPAEVKDLTITNNLGGTTWIAWTLSGNTYDINFWFVDDICITVPLLHDAKTVSIDDVPPLIINGTTITPKATVMNAGSTSPETFDVTMTATDGYSSTVTGVTLNAGAQTQVTFDAWTPAVGDWTVWTCTQLTGDLDPANDCKTKDVSVQNLRKVYGYVAYDPTAILPEGPAWFYVQDPGTITSLAATTSDQFISAGTWAEGIWYGSEYYDGTIGGGWWTIDTVNGAMTKVADFDLGFTGITYNKNTGVMYGLIYTGVGTNYNDLYTIDRLTGVATLLGSVGGTELLIDLASDGSNYLYGTAIFSDYLYQIDPALLTTTAVGSAGYDFNYAQDMEYDYDNNVMYHAGYTNTGSLYTVNMLTGAYSLIGNFQGGSEICGFAIPYSTACTTNTWTGAEGNAWDEANNWSCGQVPDMTMSVIIPSGLTNYPVVGDGVTAECFDMSLETGATFVVATGGTCNIVNP